MQESANRYKTISFLRSQIAQIRHGGRAVLFRKVGRILFFTYRLPLFILVIPVVLAVRLISPWLIIRWGMLASQRIGHFAGNTELYLCERDAGINVPKLPHIDIFFFMDPPICNRQLAKMWMRMLRIFPGWWIFHYLRDVNRLIPGGDVHEVGDNTNSDLDVHNLLDRFPPHLKFTSEEEWRGEIILREMGIPADAPFVCLIVRDSAYLDAHQKKDWSYHNYRDSSIQNYILASEALADRGYYVIRMGAKVRDAIRANSPKIIDYAAGGMRSDFMDIFLGAKCTFCISTATGFDAVPIVFRRPIVYVNMVPIGYLYSSRAQSIGITKHHFSQEKNKELTISEIFKFGVGFGLKTSDYESNGIRLVENTPEEIRDAVLEMADRLTGTWLRMPEDDTLQSAFWKNYPVHARDVFKSKRIHGEVRIRIGAKFLRSNVNFVN